jgi:hypothetical protein
LFLDPLTTNMTLNSVTSNGSNTGNNTGITLDEVSGTVTIGTVDIDNPLGEGILIVNSTGTFTFNGGDITGAVGSAFKVDGTGSGDSSTTTYRGTINNTTGRSVEVINKTGGSVNLTGNISDTGSGVLASGNSGGTAVTLSGSVKTLNTGPNNAVTLNNNTGATISFTGGGLDIDTTSGTGFVATGGGTIVTSGINNTIAATNGMAINLDAVTTNIIFARASSTNSAAQGINLTNLSAGSIFNGGVTTVTSANGVGINIANIGANADIDFSTTNVNGRNDTGILINNVAGGGGTVTFGTTTVGVPAQATATAGIDVRNSAAAMTFNRSNTNGGQIGIALTNNSGNFTSNGGTNVGTSGAALDIDQGNANITIANFIDIDDGRSVEVTGRTGGQITLTGPVSDLGVGILISGNSAGTTTFNNSKLLDTGANAAVTLTNNTGHTINFANGGLDISTTTGHGLVASGGGTLNITNGSLGNSIATSGGTGLSISDTTIGSSGVNFVNIDVDGAVNGIVLNNTGNSGGLSIIGNGAPNSGGTIQNTSGDGMVLNNTQDFSATSILILNTAGHGIVATDLRGSNNLLRDSEISEFDTGATQTWDGFRIINNNVNLGLLTVENTLFSNTGGKGNEGLFIQAQGTASIDATVLSNTFSDVGFTAQTLDAGSAMQLDLRLNDASGTGPHYNLINSAGTFNVLGSTTDPVTPADIDAAQNSGSSSVSGTINFKTP